MHFGTVNWGALSEWPYEKLEQNSRLVPFRASCRLDTKRRGSSCSLALNGNLPSLDSAHRHKNLYRWNYGIWSGLASEWEAITVLRWVMRRCSKEQLNNKSNLLQLFRFKNKL